MFQVKLIQKLRLIAIHRVIFFIFLAFLPIQTRILYKPENAYIDWYFDYHLGFFLYFTDILLLTCFMTWLAFDKPEWSKLAKNSLFFLILAFLSITLVSLFHVKHLSLGAYQAIKWLEFFLLLIYVHLTFKNFEDFKIAAWILYLSAVFQAALGFWQFHVQHMIGLDWIGEYISPLGTPGLATIETVAGKIIRAYGTMPHPNILGGFLVLGLCLGLYLLSQKQNKIYVSLGLLVILLGMFATFSRLSWMAIIPAILIFCAYYFWTSKKTLAALTILPILITVSTILIFYRPTLQARTIDTNNASFTDRFFFNNLGLSLIKQNSILGVGVGNYMPSINDAFQLEPWQHQPAHNIFIFIAAELGLLGLGLFIMILFEVFAGASEVLKNPLGMSLITIGILFLMLGQFDHYFVTVQQGRLMFAVVLGLIAALPNIHDHQKTD